MLTPVPFIAETGKHFYAHAATVSTPLHARRLPDPAPGAIALRITGEFDRTATRMRAPRIMVGHRIAMEAELTFTRR